ncbi:MAG: FtsX-like permease family protein [Myxococcota bacterium]
MESLRSALATYLATAGGGIAVAFIVLLAVGIVAMTLLYVGSALLVLDRFARVARGWIAPALAGVCVAGFVALLATLESYPSDSVYAWTEWWSTFAQKLAVGVGSCAIFLVAVGVATRRVSQATLGLVVAGIAALAAGFAVAPLGQALPLFGAALGIAVVAGLLDRRARARAGGEGDRSALVGVLFAVAAGLLPGALARWLPESAVLAGQSASAGLVGLLLGAIVLGLVPLAIAGFVSMRRSVEWFIALRYLVAKRRQVFISAITAICVAGIAAGVWLIIVVLSVMNGFEQTWREEILGNRAHFTVHSSFGPFEDWESVMKTVVSVPGVEAASPYLDAEGMVRGSHGEIASVRLRGIDPASVGRVTDLESDLRSVEGEGAPDLVARFAKQGADANAPGIVIGGHLASSMGLAVGDSMLLISPFGGPPTPLGPGPRLKRFTVVGIFESSFYQYDEAFTYTTLEAARDFRKVGAVVDGIEARTTDHYRSRIVGDQVQEALGYPYYTRDWKEVFPAFFQALKTERVMMFLLLTMIMVVAAFVIVATLIMMIMEKSSDIAILKAMGAEDAMIERIFALEGTLIGLCGTALGVAAGIAVTGQLSWIQDRIERITGIDTLPASVYQFSELPSKVDPGQVAGVAVIAMILSLGATLLPSRQGSRIDPAAGLRHE